MRVATSGDRRRPFKNAPVKLARPVCKTVPADLRKILTQCGDIGVVADAVEPFEHERRILALLASRGDWDFLIVDRAADGVREDFACSSPDNSSPAKSNRLPNTCSRRSTKAETKAPMSARATSWRTRLGGIAKAYVPWRSAPIDHGATMVCMKATGALMV